MEPNLTATNKPRENFYSPDVGLDVEMRRVNRRMYTTYINPRNVYDSSKPVFIESGPADEVTIKVNNKRHGENWATLKLNGDVRTVRVILKRPKPGTPVSTVDGIGQSLWFNPTVEVEGKDTFYHIVLTGKEVTYPLSLKNVKFLRDYYDKPIGISLEGKIFDTFGNFVRVQDTDINPSCTLSIMGDGEIREQVVFKNCEGRVVRDRDLPLFYFSKPG